MIFLTIGLIGLLISVCMLMLSQGKPAGKLGNLCIRTASICWGAYLAWEILAIGVGWNIRIDLLVIYPFLLILTLGAVIASFASLLRRNH